MSDLILFCPRCHAELELTKSQRSFDVIFASWTACPGCGAEILIKDNVPTLPAAV